MSPKVKGKTSSSNKVKADKAKVKTDKIKVKKVKQKKGVSTDDGNDSSRQPPPRPTNEELRIIIRRLVPKVDLHETGVKAFMTLLSRECNGLDLKPQYDFIKEALADAINEMDSDDNNDDDDDDDDDDIKPAAAAGGGGRGLSVKKEVSAKLSKFLGQGNEMARTQVVKLLWAYIKENDLQNPQNKREIILDDAMRGVFGVQTFTMFTMNKYVGAHIHPFKPVDLTPKEKPTKGKRKIDEAISKNKKRQPKKVGTQPPYRLSPQLAEIVGRDVLPRPQVVQGLWEYIKSKNLQNPNDKREILCDSRLKVIMGGNDKVTMFNMNRFVTEHLVEKLDRSAYVHGGGGEDVVDDDVDNDDDVDDDDE